ncbi:MAG: hypothetical protein IJW63_02150 [Lachnospiraceae bacterium]|nr:hypothetical protein [Lachnospiraceae bacterium]
MINKQTGRKAPLTRDAIYRIMIYLCYIVSAFFLVKDLAGGEITGALLIAGCLGAFSIILAVMKALKVSKDRKRFIVSIGLVVLIFFISLGSGNYYSDDYAMYLAALGLTGLYLRPNYTKWQLVASMILMVVQFIIFPHKADPLGQFIMCMLTFALAGAMIYLCIHRGHQFIIANEAKAEDAEALLKSLGELGTELGESLQTSAKLTDSMNEANEQLTNHAEELERGSTNISAEANMVAEACEEVQFKIQTTEGHIGALNNEIRTFENTLASNQRNVNAMSAQMESTKAAVEHANEVFHTLEQQMLAITEVTEQLNKISSSTTMLALNASIEAARAGAAGAGFSVVATKVQGLAVDSTACANEVAEVVNSMKVQIAETSQQLIESISALDISLGSLENLSDGFEVMGNQFQELYSNIEAQNTGIREVNDIFAGLRGQVDEMSSYSEENQMSVQAIAEAMHVYTQQLTQVIEDSKHLQALSETMMELSQQDLEKIDA